MDADVGEREVVVYTRWAATSFLWERLRLAWRRTSGWVRLVALLVWATLLIATGILGLLITALALLLVLAGAIGRAYERWRTKDIVRYAQEAENVTVNIADELHWLRREIEIRDHEIERLRQGCKHGRTPGGR